MGRERTSLRDENTFRYCLMSPCLSFSLQFLPFSSRGPREPSSPGYPSGLSFGKVTSCFPPVPRRRYGFCRLGMTGLITSGMPGFVPCLAADLPFFFRMLLIKIKEKFIHAHNRREVNTRSIISDIIVFFSCFMSSLCFYM